jgi:hypothetical protein
LLERETPEHGETRLANRVIGFAGHPSDVFREDALNGRQSFEELVALPLAPPLVDLQAWQDRARLRRRHSALFCPHRELLPSVYATVKIALLAGPDQRFGG